MKAGRGGRRTEGDTVRGCRLLSVISIGHISRPKYKKYNHMYSDSEIEIKAQNYEGVCSLNLDFFFPNDNTLSLC